MTTEEIRNLEVPFETIAGKLPPGIAETKFKCVILREIAAQLAELNQKQAQPQPTITQSGHNFTLDCPHCGVKTQGTITR